MSPTQQTKLTKNIYHYLLTGKKQLSNIVTYAETNYDNLATVLRDPQFKQVRGGEYVLKELQP